MALDNATVVVNRANNQVAVDDIPSDPSENAPLTAHAVLCDRHGWNQVDCWGASIQRGQFSPFSGTLQGTRAAESDGVAMKPYDKYAVWTEEEQRVALHWAPKLSENAAIIINLKTNIMLMFDVACFPSAMTLEEGVTLDNYVGHVRTLTVSMKTGQASWGSTGWKNGVGMVIACALAMSGWRRCDVKAGDCRSGRLRFNSISIHSLERHNYKWRGNSGGDFTQDEMHTALALAQQGGGLSSV